MVLSHLLCFLKQLLSFMVYKSIANDINVLTMFIQLTLSQSLIVHTKDIHFHTVNISWSSPSQSIYSLIIVTSIKTCTAQPQILQLHQPYLLLKVPHPVRSTTSLSLPLMLVPPTLELVAVYPAQCSAGCYLLYLIKEYWSRPLTFPLSDKKLEI